jgi:hypothetical protein
MTMLHALLWLLTHAHHAPVVRCLCPIRLVHHNPFGLPPGFNPGGPIRGLHFIR